MLAVPHISQQHESLQLVVFNLHKKKQGPRKGLKTKKYFKFDPG